MIVDAARCFGIEEPVTNSKVTRELDVRPMVERIAKQLRHRGSVLLELFPMRGIAGAEAFVDACGAHRPPFVVIAAKPERGDVVPTNVVRNFLRRKMAMIVNNRQIGRVTVVKLARGGRVEKEVFVDEGAGIHSQLAEKWIDVFFEQVIADSASNNLAMSLQGIGVARADCGGNFE